MFKKPNSGGKRGGNLSQYGLLDIPDVDDADEPMDMSDDDLDLEAELAAISGGKGQKPKPRKPAPVPAANLDAMIAESLKDVPSDDDVSGDEDDPDLLSELRELAIEDDEAPAPPPRMSRPAPPVPLGADSSSTLSVIQDRILNYTAAEKQAKEKQESGRARRFNRGLKTLNDLLKQVRAGKPINEADIPPPVSLGQSAPAQPSAIPSAPVLTPEKPSPEEPSPLTSPPAEEPSPTNEKPSAPAESPSSPSPIQPNVDDSLSPERREGLQVILKRKQEFKAAALSCKHSGDKAMALEYLKVVKQFDFVLDAWRKGEDMDLRELPTPEAIAAAFKAQQKAEATNEQSTEPAPAPPVPNTEGGLITASSMDEALRQRLAAFQEQEAKAKESGNAAKARRLGRIVKSYQDAIKLNAAGKPVPVDELAILPGYAPFPTSGSNASGPPSSTPSSASSSHPSPNPSPRPASSARYDKQLALLLHKQKQFKEAAIKAKKDGDIEKAKEYLRAAKGFDAVIEAAKGGLVVDLKSLPLAPKTKDNIEHTFDVVSAEDCGPSDDNPTISADDDDVIERLINQLTSQLKLCLSNRDHYKAMGNVAETNRFEHLAVAVKQDLDVVKMARRSGGNPPKFHYESRQFSVVQCNTDLNENDLELTIVRGIAYNVTNPKDVDTYVKFEFPYPQEAPVSDKTSLVKDTNSPQYDAVFPLSIQRNQRACQRVFKRHGVKFEVYSRGGWFSKDSLLGTATVKLAPLETNVTIHEAFPLMDGRRPAGGSLEVKLRVRTPLQQQHIEHSTHRWLLIDN